MIRNTNKIILLGLMSALALTGCNDKDSISKDIPTMYTSGSFVINMQNLNEVVGHADYVFVAKVDEIVDTVYRDPVTIETETGYKVISDPYTIYSITNIDNIKGKLKKNESILIEKDGGLSEDKKAYILKEGDFLPEVGEYYIFVAYSQSDGTLVLSGPKSNISLNASSKSEIMSSKEYKDFKKAFKNEVKMDIERFKAKYEE